MATSSHSFRVECQLVIQGLYAITDSQLGDHLLASVAAALAGGARVVQYRDKIADRLNPADFEREQARRLDEASALLALCRQYQVPLLINDDVELAARISADGVHLGQSDGQVATARAHLGEHAIIGVTCHNRIELALQAVRDGASYVAFGAVFASATKPQAQLCSLATLRAARAQLTLPLVAIGGITPDNVASVIDAGADAVAVIANLWQAPDIRQRAQQFSQEFIQP
jgi:thiamine-phosphate diphosphorylase